MKNTKTRIAMIGWVALATILLTAGSLWAQAVPEDYQPTARVVYPNLSSAAAKRVPATVTIGVMGTDPDAEDNLPAKWRMLWVSAQYDTGPGGEPIYIRTPFDYDLHKDKVISWDDPAWSPWIDYSPDMEDRWVTFPQQEDGVYFLFVVQTMDADGAVSTGLDYQIEVMHLHIQVGAFRPEVVLSEPFLPTLPSTVASYEIAAGQPLNFYWEGSAAGYNSEIDSYRHGWDLLDPNDPNDPGWAVPAGLEPENLVDEERVFQDGIHILYVRVEDEIGQVRLMERWLHVVPFVDIAYQLPLALVDQVADKNVNTWPDANGNPRDNEVYRDAYWSFIGAGSGGVSGFDGERDWFDDTETMHYSDIVQYRAVLCYARFNALNQTLFRQFRPVNGEDQYVWLEPYQQRGGNFFLVGEASMESFLESKPNYMVPMIFDTRETVYFLDGQDYVLGFGQKVMPDGSTVDRGVRMYPYATAGIAAMDWTSPNTKYIFDRTITARWDRDVECVGLKQIVLDPTFRSTHGVAVGAIADTIQGDADIDWQDPYYISQGTLGLDNGTFWYRKDEFYDTNISTRSTPIIPQDCVAGPLGQCVEPMWRGVSRMDWMREYYWSQGQVDWPLDEYTLQELENNCGELGLTSYDGRPMSSARTNDKVYGFMSYKAIADKPSNKADVYWGFDPYRFDHIESQKAVRWVLDYFGLQINP